MKVLIIGGTGFIGARLARRLEGIGQQVVCMDMAPDPWHLGEAASRVELLRGDVANFDEVMGAIVEHKADQVVNLAYVLSADSEARLHAGVRVNILGMNNVFEAARLAGVKRVLYASSVAAQGYNMSPEPRTINEDTDLRPTGVYGWAKLFNEVMASRYAAKYGMTMAAVRPAVVFGPGRRAGNIAQSQLINEAALGRPVTVQASPETRAALVHVDDVAELFFRLSQAPAIRHQVYHTGGDVVSFQELAGMVQGFLPGARISFDPAARPRLGLSYHYDYARAREEFGMVRPPLAQRVLETMNATRAMASMPLIGS